MRKRGIDSASTPTSPRIEKEMDGYRVHFKRGDSLHAGLVMAATGRLPNTMGLGLDKAGVELGWNGHVVVDEFSRSSVGQYLCRGRRDRSREPDAGRHP